MCNIARQRSFLRKLFCIYQRLGRSLTSAYLSAAHETQSASCSDTDARSAHCATGMLQETLHFDLRRSCSSTRSAHKHRSRSPWPCFALTAVVLSSLSGRLAHLPHANHGFQDVHHPGDTTVNSNGRACLNRSSRISIDSGHTVCQGFGSESVHVIRAQYRDHTCAVRSFSNNGLLMPHSQ